MADYHENRNKLMHSSGSSPLETFLTVIPSFFHTFITTTIISLIMSLIALNKPKQICIEFIILIIPLVLDLTIFSSLISTIVLYLIGISIILSIFIYSMKPAKKKIILIRYQNDFVTNARSTINVLSVIAILAVDFRVFPRHFTKTISYGYSLMDMGVGLYVFSNGIVAPEVTGKKDSLTKTFISSLPLIILGLARCLITKEIDYNVPVSEYGVHWNFFITLAITKIFTSLIISSVKIKYIYINAMLLMISHEVLLQAGLKNLVFKDHKRHNLIFANKEGLVSCFGYINLYLMSLYCGYILDLRNSRTFIRKSKISPELKTCIKFFVIAFGSLSMALIFQREFGISRRLANSAYCFWILFIGIFMTWLFYLGELFQRYIFGDKLTYTMFTPCIFEAINHNGLIFFLVGNLLTGLINVLCDTLKVNTVDSIIIIVIYMFVNCIVVSILFIKKIKLKL